MTDKLSFWAQNLDNTGTGHYVLRGELLEADDLDMIEVMMQELSRVTAQGTKEDIDEHLELFCLDEEFVVRFCPQERDVGGRLSPVAGHGLFPRQWDERWIEESVEEILRFVDSIGRSVGEETKVGLRRALLKGHKKKLRRRIQTLTRGQRIGVMVLAVLAMSCLVFVTVLFVYFATVQ